MILKKILSIVLVILFAVNSFNVVANNKEKTENNDNIEVLVAVYTDDDLDEDFYGPYGRTCRFLFALENYTWQVNDKTYIIKTTILRTEDIISGKLTLENFHVFLYPPDSFNEYFTIHGIRFLPKNVLRMRKIQNFVKSGGGFYGTCGGSMIAGDLANTPKTVYEKLIKNCCLKISQADVIYKGALPVLGQLSEYGYKSPWESAYIQYSGWNLTDDTINYNTGVSMDVQISKNNGIFDDFADDTRRIRWVGGPPFILPESSDNIDVIASFPEEDISDNESTDIHYWKYTGGLIGMIKGLFSDEEILWGASGASLLGSLMKAVILAEDWEMTDEIVQVNYSNMPFMITENYPNENKARIVRCTGHPEDNVWWGGHIEELEDTNHNNMYDAFHRWMDIIPENETEENEFEYNYCINRRSVAWAAKIPDNDLPPVYGPSQICDIYPYNHTSSVFTIYGISEKQEGMISLDLYYRYSLDNSTWSKWAIYETDEDESNGWSWNFNSPQGPGYYQFYSIRHLINKNNEIIESLPPCPDAIVRVI